jgi:hypothetical protein
VRGRRKGSLTSPEKRHKRRWGNSNQIAAEVAAALTWCVRGDGVGLHHLESTAMSTGEDWDALLARSQRLTVKEAVTIVVERWSDQAGPRPDWKKVYDLVRTQRMGTTCLRGRRSN